MHICIKELNTTEEAREFQKNIYFCFIDYAKAFDCVDHNKQWKILEEMGIPDCSLVNEYTCSVQLRCSVVSDSLRPHESQHARLPVPHQLLEFTQTHIH